MKHIEMLRLVLFLSFSFSTLLFAQSIVDKQTKNKNFNVVFTQGLIIENNIAWESSGLYGHSMLTKWDLDTGKIIKQRKFADKYFAEGLTQLNGKLYMLTWREQTAFVIDKQTLEIIDTINYTGEGWGLTTNNQQLIMSNGTNVLQFIDAETFKVSKSLKVHINGSALNRLNELEYIDGKIWANVYQTDYIVVIDPSSGAVLKNYHLPNLLKKHMRKPGVLNGIAYDTATKKIWVTGKNWPALFEL
ncbi:MAG: glutaminyl-peptide cyclotransferase [Proteobacteria bacterium]|nr:glutaminyl-peptide cyclotransferase [Pseudomonadota bacterium]